MVSWTRMHARVALPGCWLLVACCFAGCNKDTVASIQGDPVAQIRQLQGQPLAAPYDAVESVTNEQGVVKVRYRYTLIHGRPGIMHFNEYRQVVSLTTKADAVDLLRCLQGKEPLPESATSQAYRDSSHWEKAELVNCYSLPDRRSR